MFSCHTSRARGQLQDVFTDSCIPKTLAQGMGTQYRDRGGLNDDGIACCQRSRNAPKRDGNGKIPWWHYHAHTLSPKTQIWPLKGAHSVAIVFQKVNSLTHFHIGFGKHLAQFRCGNPYEVSPTSTHHIGYLAQGFMALGSRETTPPIGVLVCHLYCKGQILWRCLDVCTAHDFLRKLGLVFYVYALAFPHSLFTPNHHRTNKRCLVCPLHPTLTNLLCPCFIGRQHKIRIGLSVVASCIKRASLVVLPLFLQAVLETFWPQGRMGLVGEGI